MNEQGRVNAIIGSMKKPRDEAPVVTKARPFFKSAGGKTRLLPDLMKHVPKTFGAYHEPFVGGGAMFWALADRVQEVHLSDLSRPLAEAYAAVQVEPKSVIQHLRKMKNEEAFFLRERDRDPTKMSDSRLAAWFLYLNKVCFNGLWRVNRSGKFNVPFGRYDNPKICDEPLLLACSARLRMPRVRIWCEGFHRVTTRAVKGDLVYFDPPYLPISKTSDFTAYTKQGFTVDDHVRLRDVACQLKKDGVKVIISNSDHVAIREMYARGFKVHEVFAARAINSDGAGRGKITELIIT